MDRDNVEVPEFFKIPFCIFEKWAHMRGFETIVLLDIMRNSAISLWVCVCFSTISFSQSKLSSSPTALRARSSKCEISVCVAYLNSILFLFACEENQGQLIYWTKMQISRAKESTSGKKQLMIHQDSGKIFSINWDQMDDQMALIDAPWNCPGQVVLDTQHIKPLQSWAFHEKIYNLLSRKMHHCSTIVVKVEWTRPLYQNSWDLYR